MRYKIPLEITEIKLTYCSKVKADNRPHVKSVKDAFSILKYNWSDQIGLLEEFNILLLDRSNRVMSMCQISKGGISSTIVDLKILFAAAIKGRASALILSHNHPSGRLDPSKLDIQLTKRINEIGELLDIRVFDHIILSPEGDEYYSFSENDLLP